MLKFEDQKTMTTNPFIDSLLYNLKLMSYNCIVKDQQTADNNETIESLKQSGIYIACVENHADLALFNIIPHKFLIQVGMTDREIELYEKNYDQFYIPEKYKESLKSLMIPYFIETYQELNQYYRKITGLPPIGDPGIPLRDYEYLLPEDFTYDEPYLHENDVDVCKYLNQLGILDIIKMDYPDAEYIDYLDKGLNLYEVRKKLDFQILWYPSEVNYAVIQEFTYRYAENRNFILSTFYQDVMEFQSEHYHSFMQITLILITMMDLLTEVQDHIVKKDMLDRRCVEYIFSMYGIPYYKSIPYKYQERMCKNINSLVKFKSSTTEMMNLIKIFGFDDINIFKYYILKDRKTNAWGEFEYEKSEQLICSHNDIILHETLVEQMSEPSPELPVPPNLDWYPDESIASIEYNKLNDNNLKNLFKLNDENKTIISTINALNTNSEESLESINENNEFIKQNKANTIRYIKYPFDYFLQKGNVMFVKLDGYVLKENIDYEIHNYNQIHFLNGIDSGKSKLEYEFYYDKDTIDQAFQVDIEHSVETIVKRFPSTKTRTNVLDLKPIKWQSFLTNKNQVIVMVSSVWLHPDMYTVDYDNAKVIIDTNLVEIKNLDIEVILIYSKSLKTQFEKHCVTMNETNHIVMIPEPFTHYCINENSFFVTIGNTYIDRKRYQIYANSEDNKSYIKFTDGTKVKKGRDVVFNFLYSTNAIVNKIILEQKIIKITATKYYQYEFNIQFPVNHYSECRYKAYIKLLDWWLPEEKYTIVDDKITFLDQSIALQPEDTMEVYLVYVNKDRTQKEFSNVKVASDYRIASKDKQSNFDIKYPVKHYWTKENTLIVDVEGILLKENIDYTVDKEDDGDSITLLTLDYKPMEGQRVNYTFIYNQDAEYIVQLEAQNIPITSKNQTDFELQYPFFPYNETNQSFLVLVGSTLIDQSRISISNQFTLHVDGLDTEETALETYITVLYIYNNYYILNSSPKLIVEWKPVQIIDNKMYIDIPTPFDYYIENDWDYFVTYNNRQYLDDDKYDVYNSTFYTYPGNDLLNRKYGDIITFVFIYLIKEPYVWKQISENYDATTNLYFCKIPLDDLYSSQYLKDKSRYKDYDMITRGDGWWEGLYYKDNNSQLVKTAIYNEKWNYARTKYYLISQTIELSEYSAQVSYFYSMLYDDVFLEEELKILVPSLSPAHKFKLAHLFIFMTCLTYIFNQLEDFIIDNPSKILFVKGFNFKTSLDEMKEYLRLHHQQQSDYPIWDMIIPINQIKDMTEFMNIYKTDLNVRNTIIKLMMNSNTYDEYKIWNHLYNSLMTWELNLSYFKLDNGNMATTYSEFLQEKDPILYQLLQEVKSISDYETLQDTIINIVDDIVYILSEWIDTDEFKYIFERFPGQSGEYALNYVLMMIEFFKSYKIVFLTKSIDISIGGNGEDPDSSMKPFDTFMMKANVALIEYMPPLIEEPSFKISFDLAERDKEHEGGKWMREDYDIKITNYKTGASIDGILNLNKSNYNYYLSGNIEDLLSINKKSDITGNLNIEKIYLNEYLNSQLNINKINKNQTIDFILNIDKSFDGEFIFEKSISEIDISANLILEENKNILVVQPTNIYPINTKLSINNEIFENTNKPKGTELDIKLIEQDENYELSQFYKGKFIVKIIQSEHQRIKVTLNDSEWFDTDFVTTVDDNYKIDIIPDEGYTAGRLINPISEIGNFDPNGDNTITATNAEIIMCNLKIIQPEHGKIYVNDEYGTDFTFEYGTEITIKIELDEGYELNDTFASDQLTYTLTTK